MSLSRAVGGGALRKRSPTPATSNATAGLTFIMRKRGPVNHTSTCSAAKPTHSASCTRTDDFSRLCGVAAFLPQLKGVRELLSVRPLFHNEPPETAGPAASE